MLELSPVWVVGTSCRPWRGRWHWHGSLCSHWYHSL